MSAQSNAIVCESQNRLLNSEEYTAPQFSDIDRLRRPELLTEKELRTTVGVMYEATQGLFAHGSPTELSTLLENAFTAYIQSDEFLSQRLTPSEQAAATAQIFQMRRFLYQMHGADGRVFKKSKKRFQKGA